ncbi:MAG: bidirectional hydrogenase complex protein HoxE [Desulfomonile sp.]|nr:bidirectional hydrogenase complex protein HoxE [Desulfomonile sp.]
MDEQMQSAMKSTEDRRWRLVNRTMRLHGHEPHALIETLHAVQEHFGFLDLDALKYVSQALRVPLSRTYGVATFYHHFTLKPPGEHTCVVCKGTACYIGGASGILDDFEKTVGIGPGQTTPDGKISLVTARCLGSCGLAPAVVFDGEVCGRMTSEAVLERIRRWTDHDPDD